MLLLLKISSLISYHQVIIYFYSLYFIFTPKKQTQQTFPKTPTMHNSNITINSTSSTSNNHNLNLPQLLNNPLQESHYPYLEPIIKILNEYLQKCVKNRQYLQAQKTKDKIQQAHQAIKKRNANSIVDRMTANVKKLETKHEEERMLFIDQWAMRVNMVQEKYDEGIEKKRRANQQQIMRLREQVELALPISHSPDDKLKALRHEEKRLANTGNFLQAQRIKDQIQNRQLMLQEKHRKLRESNIKAMLAELEERHEKDMKERLKQKKNAIDELVKERNKKQKELEERHGKEMRELKWMHNEELRIIGNSG